MRLCTEEQMWAHSMIPALSRVSAPKVEHLHLPQRCRRELRPTSGEVKLSGIGSSLDFARLPLSS